MNAPALSNAHQHLGTTTDGRALVRLVLAAAPVTKADGSQWIQVMPLGPQVQARDGRAFQVTDARAVAAKCELPMLIDFEHQSESFLGSTRAAGWVEELFVEDGKSKRFPRPGVWGRAEWTPQGKGDVASKAFRFLSPVLLLDEKTRDVQTIASVALTNRPALDMQGLAAFSRLKTATAPANGATPSAPARAPAMTAEQAAAHVQMFEVNQRLARGESAESIAAEFEAKARREKSAQANGEVRAALARKGYSAHEIDEMLAAAETVNCSRAASSSGVDAYARRQLASLHGEALVAAAEALKPAGRERVVEGVEGELARRGFSAREVAAAKALQRGQGVALPFPVQPVTACWSPAGNAADAPAATGARPAKAALRRGAAGGTVVDELHRRGFTDAEIEAASRLQVSRGMKGD